MKKLFLGVLLVAASSPGIANAIESSCSSPKGDVVIRRGSDISRAILYGRVVTSPATIVRDRQTRAIEDIPLSGEFSVTFDEKYTDLGVEQVGDESRMFFATKVTISQNVRRTYSEVFQSLMNSHGQIVRRVICDSPLMVKPNEK